MNAKKVMPAVNGEGERNSNNLHGTTEQGRTVCDKLSTRRFRAYIERWRDTVACPEVRLPSTRAPLERALPLVTAIRQAGECGREKTNRAIAPCERLSRNTTQPSPEQRTHAMTTALVVDDNHRLHFSSDAGDYERPLRVEHAVDHLRAVGLYDRCCVLQGHPARTRDLLRVHTRELVDSVDQTAFVLSLRGTGSATVGQDLYATANTAKAARAAAGCVMEAARAVMQGRAANALALTRPPGHHAGINNSAGFCFFNNVAVAVRAIQDEGCVPDDANSKPMARLRVLVIDWDVHHGDGTEQIFYEDPSVLVISIHQYANGRGHVLRRPHKDDANEKHSTSPMAHESSTALNVDELAAFMPSQDELERQAHTMTAAQEGKTPATNVAESMQKNEEAKEVRCGKRSRPPVDYDTLAHKLNDEAQNGNLDQAAAAFFDLHVGATRASSEAETSSTSTASTSTQSYSAGAMRKLRLAGDTSGQSSIDDGQAGHQQAKGEHTGLVEDLFYPATGHGDRLGGDIAEEAKGYNINVPWPTHGMGDLEYMLVMLNIVAPVCHDFNPDIIFVSCGFDSARGDLLGSMNLTPSGYYVMTRVVTELCPRVVVALEGGYNARNVALCSEAVIRALLQSGNPNVKLPPSDMLWEQALKTVNRTAASCAPYWKSLRENK